MNLTLWSEWEETLKNFQYIPDFDSAAICVCLGKGKNDMCSCMPEPLFVR